MGYIGLNNIVPLVLETAGMKMSVYYQYMLDLMKQVPVLTSYGCYIDVQGAIYQYEEETQYTDDIDNYFYLEYQNLSGGRRQDLFTAQ